MGARSRTKGKAGEREWAAFLRDLGIDARRSQQYAGGVGSADVVSDLAGVHWEVKRYARIAAARFLDQAVRDSAGESAPVVAMREDRGPWILMLRAEDLPKVATAIAGVVATSPTTSDT